ncbi:hypothetical protein NY08_4213 [Rhodococcus sp. B7740]|nr:hypothetical protein NY08_4213 [Rhodococcus sp. B7740]
MQRTTSRSGGEEAAFPDRLGRLAVETSPVVGACVIGDF